MIRPWLTPLQQLTLADWAKTLTWVSAGFSLPVIAVNCALPARRRFPSRMTTYFALMAMFFHATIGIGTFTNFSQLRNPTGTLCQVQGVLFQLFASTLIWWWFLISFTLHRIVCKGWSFDVIQQYRPRYELVGWGAPVLLTALPVLTRKIGAETGLAWCWLVSTDYSLWKLLYFHVWMFIFMCFGLYWGIRILATLHNMRKRFQSMSEQLSDDDDVATAVQLSVAGGDDQPRILTDYLRRHFIFLTSFLIIFSGAFAWVAQKALWMQDLAPPPSYTLSGFVIITVCLTGTLGFLMFGFTYDNQQLLSRVARSCCSRNTSAVSTPLIAGRARPVSDL